MKLIVFIALTLLLASCKQEPAKPKDLMGRLQAGNLSDEDLLKVTSQFPGMTSSCVEKVRKRGINAMAGRSDACFEMTPQQRWTGVWRNDFEGSEFCPGATRECSYASNRDTIWLTIKEGMPQYEMQGRGGVYLVDFIGRRTLYPGTQGHMGTSKYEMIVDRMISMNQLAPPPPPMTKAQQKAWDKDCEAAPNCLTPTEMQVLHANN